MRVARTKLVVMDELLQKIHFYILGDVWWNCWIVTMAQSHVVICSIATVAQVIELIAKNLLVRLLDYGLKQ